MVDTWTFGDRPDAGGLRAKAGDLLEVRFANGLTGANTLHWHGIALRNDMDGVHDLTQHPTEPGGEFVYRFTVPDPGTRSAARYSSARSPPPLWWRSR